MLKIHKIFLLKPFERMVLTQAYILLCSVRAMLFLFPFPMVRKVLRCYSGFSASPNRRHIVPLERIIWSVKTASRCVPNGKHCLTRAIVAKILLQRYGYESTFRIGVYRGKEKLQAHAWLEKDGCVLIGTLPDLAAYTPFLPMYGDLI